MLTTCAGLGLRNLDTKALQIVFEVLQQQFPESLSELWFLNAPFIFWGLWKVVSPFIQPTTKEKIKFLSGGRRAQMLDDNLPYRVRIPGQELQYSALSAVGGSYGSVSCYERLFNAINFAFLTVLRGACKSTF